MSVSVLNTDAGLSGKTLDLLESDQTITGNKTFDRDPSAPFTVTASSAVVTNLDADKVDGQHGSYYNDPANLSAAVPVAKGGTALTGTPTNGQLPIGNGTGYTLAAITAGSGVTVTNGAGSIQISAATVLDKTNTEVVVNNTGVETTLYSFSVPSGTLSTTNAIRLSLAGYIDMNTTSVNGTIKVKFGGTVIASGVVASTATTKGGFYLDAIVSSMGATNVQRAVVRYVGPGNAAPADGTLTTTTTVATSGMSSGLTIDTTSAAILLVTWTWASANVNSTAKMFSATTEKLA